MSKSRPKTSYCISFFFMHETKLFTCWFKATLDFDILASSIIPRSIPQYPFWIGNLWKTTSIISQRSISRCATFFSGQTNHPIISSIPPYTSALILVPCPSIYQVLLSDIVSIDISISVFLICTAIKDLNQITAF